MVISDIQDLGLETDASFPTPTLNALNVGRQTHSCAWRIHPTYQQITLFVRGPGCLCDFPKPVQAEMTVTQKKRVHSLRATLPPSSFQFSEKLLTVKRALPLYFLCINEIEMQPRRCD